MSKLFIPPPGVIQFLVERAWDGGPIPEDWNPYILWVIPATEPINIKSQKVDCPHEFGFSAIAQTSPKTNETKILYRDGKVRVCECVGRIIE